MNRITFSADIANRLKSTSGRLEVCDESGRTIGYFTPPLTKRIGISEPTREELDASESEPMYTTQEVLEYVLQSESRT